MSSYFPLAAASTRMEVWDRTIGPGKQVRVNNGEVVQLTNACVGVYQSPDADGRCSLLFAEEGRTPVAISSFHPRCDQDRLDIVLEAGTSYVFSVQGPFTINIVGYTIPSHQPNARPSTYAFSSDARSSSIKASRVGSGLGVSSGKGTKHQDQGATTQVKEPKIKIKKDPKAKDSKVKKSPRMTDSERPAKRKAGGGKATVRERASTQINTQGRAR